MDKRYKVLTSVVFKTGTSNKNGKSIPWTIFKVTLDGYNGEVTGFDTVNQGDEVTIKTTQNGKYTNTNYEKVSPDKEESSNSGGGSDRRVLKLLVLVAEQVGIDRSKVMEILEQ